MYGIILPVYKSIKLLLLQILTKCSLHLFQGKLLLLDFNPFGQVTDGLMYTWDELTDSDVELKGTDSETKVATVILSTRGHCLKFPYILQHYKEGFIFICIVETILSGMGAPVLISTSMYLNTLCLDSKEHNTYISYLSSFDAVYLGQYILRPCKAKSN